MSIIITLINLSFLAKRKKTTQQWQIRRWISLWWGLPRAGLQTGIWRGEEEQDHHALGSAPSCLRRRCEFLSLCLLDMLHLWVCMFVFIMYFMSLDPFCHRPAGGATASRCQADEKENRWEPRVWRTLTSPSPSLWPLWPICFHSDPF